MDVAVVEEPAPKEEPAPAKPVRREPRRVNLQITSEPEGARVVIDGKPVGLTPFTHRLSRSEREVKVEVSRKGYEQRAREVTPDRSRKVHFVLGKGRIEL